MKVLLFGASGSLGTSIRKNLSRQNEVFCITRNELDPDFIIYGTLEYQRVVSEGSFDSVIWASGANTNDSIDNYSYEVFSDIFQANFFYIVESLKHIINAKALSTSASLVVISSIWSQQARNQKLSYSVSKSAVDSLVRSLAVDLGSRNIRVNSVCPGVVMNPMTRQNLSESQIEKFRKETPIGNLVSADDVANVVTWLASPLSKGISGQSIIVDGGWSSSRYV
jgi:3-oxoacyl-[acyl-carrier protein] reductase